MGYVLKSENAKVLYLGEDIDELSQIAARHAPYGPITVVAILPVSFEGIVVRQHGKPEMVVLQNTEVRKELTRKGVNSPGDLSVSCNPTGERVHVETINIPFRDFSDPLTDRGLVWVNASRDREARASFILRQNKDVDAVTIKSVLLQSEAAVRENVLTHFS